MLKILITALILSSTAFASQESMTIKGSIIETGISAGLQAIPFKMIVDDETQEKFIVDLAQMNYISECTSGEFKIVQKTSLSSHGYESFRIKSLKCYQ